MAGFLSSIFNGISDMRKNVATNIRYNRLVDDLVKLGEKQDVTIGYAHKFYVQNDNKKLFMYTFPAVTEEKDSKIFKRLIPELNGQEFQIFFLQEVNPNPEARHFFESGIPQFKTADFCIYGSSFSAKEFDGFVDMLGNSTLEKFALSQTPFTGNVDKLTALLKKNPLKELSLGEKELNSEKSKALQSFLPDSTIQKLYLSYEKSDENDMAGLLGNLPASVTGLDLPHCAINGKAADALCTSLKKMNKLEILDLSSCSLTSKDFSKIIQNLPLSLEKLYIESNKNLNNDDIKNLCIFMNRPDTKLSTIELSNKNISPEIQKELLKIQKDKAFLHKDRTLSETAKGQETRSKVEEEQTDTGLKSLLHQALETGNIDRAFDKMESLGVKIFPKDLEQKNEAGKTLLTRLSEKGKITSLFRPALFSDAKEFQNVFNMITKQDKELLNGQNGRPNFQKMKNSMMAASVKASIIQKGTQR